MTTAARPPKGGGFQVPPPKNLPQTFAPVGGFRNVSAPIDFNQAAVNLAGPQVQMPFRAGSTLPGVIFPGNQPNLPGTTALPIDQSFLPQAPAPQAPAFPGGFDLGSFLRGLNSPGGFTRFDPSVFMRQF